MGLVVMRKRVLFFTQLFWYASLFLFWGLRLEAQPVKNLPEQQNRSLEDGKKKLKDLDIAATKLLMVNTDSAFNLLDEALALSRTLQYPYGTANLELKKALFYTQTRNFDKSRAILDEAKTYYIRNNLSQTDIPVKWHKTMGNIYALQGYHDSSMLHLMQALEISKRLKDTSLEILIHTDIAITWRGAQQYYKAMEHLLTAEKLSLQTKAQYSLTAIYINQAINYSSLKNTTDMLHYAQKALGVARSKGDVRGQRQVLLLLANHAQLSGNAQQSIFYNNEALRLGDSSNAYSKIDPYFGLSVSYFKIGNIDQATHYGAEALKLYDQTGERTAQKASLLLHMAEVYSHANNWTKGFQTQQQYIALSDSLNDVERNRTLNQLEAQYKLAEKDKELLFQQAKVRNRNNWIVAAAFGILVISLLSTLLYRNSKKRYHILQQRKEIDELKAVINAEENERSRIAKELHDGVGGLLSAAVINLDALGSKLEQVKQDYNYNNTADIINQVSNEVRKTAHNLMPEVLIHHNLVDAIKIFCATVAKGRTIDLQVLSSGSFDDIKQELLLSVYRIVQELVHNLLKHAHASEALVQIQRSQNILSVTVEDNGRGFEEAEIKSGSGLKNIESRVRSHQAKFSIESIPDSGTSIYIEFEVPAQTNS